MTVQCDELWSFVDHKGNKQWVWLALDAETREIIGAYVGSRAAESAQKLWDSLPTVYQQCAVIYTDAWEAYRCRANDTGSSVSRVARPVTLNGLTIPSGKGFHALSDAA